jgi:hypothetical protein
MMQSITAPYSLFAFAMNFPAALRFCHSDPFAAAIRGEKG